ncbi:MAG: hypothetical protein ABL959_02640 [Pyrinomonadaceae bacterium]
MFNKFYLALLGISIAVMAFFTYYSWSWLQSIGLPAGAVAGYEYHAGLAWAALWISVVALMLLANAVLWATGRSWAVWTTLVYFSVLIVIRYFWLDQAVFSFKKTNGLFDGSFSVAPLLAVILIVLMAAIAFFDQFIIVKLRAKTYGKPEEPAVEAVETPAE